MRNCTLRSPLPLPYNLKSKKEEKRYAMFPIFFLCLDPIKRVTTDGKTGPYMCRFCDKTFRWRSCCEQHEIVHTQRRPYQCKICGQTFSYKGVQSRHEMGHSQVPRFSCQRCGKPFNRKYRWKSHIKVCEG